MCSRDAGPKGVTSSLLVMKKDQNRSDLNQSDFTLPRSKILRGKRNFERLFEKSSVLSNQSVQFRYRLYQDPSEGCLIGFVAPKKRIRSAVKRNRVKRVLREAYRLNQHFFSDLFLNKTFGLHAVFMASQEDLTYEQAEHEMLPILKKARERFLKYENQIGSTGENTGVKNEL